MKVTIKMAQIIYFSVKDKNTDRPLFDCLLQSSANSFAQDYADKNGVSVYIDTIIHNAKDFTKKKRK
jgi:hypothetical protein